MRKTETKTQVTAQLSSNLMFYAKVMNMLLLCITLKTPTMPSKVKEWRERLNWQLTERKINKSSFCVIIIIAIIDHDLADFQLGDFL